MAGSSTSVSDSLPVSSAVQSTKVLWQPIQTTENEGEKFFLCFVQTDWRYAPLCTTFGSGCTTK